MWTAHAFTPVIFMKIFSKGSHSTLQKQYCLECFKRIHATVPCTSERCNQPGYSRSGTIISIHTMGEAMNCNQIVKEVLFSEYQLLRLYMTRPTKSFASEMFLSSVLRRLVTLFTVVNERKKTK